MNEAQFFIISNRPASAIELIVRNDNAINISVIADLVGFDKLIIKEAARSEIVNSLLIGDQRFVALFIVVKQINSNYLVIRDLLLNRLVNYNIIASGIRVILLAGIIAIYFALASLVF